MTSMKIRVAAVAIGLAALTAVSACSSGTSQPSAAKAANPSASASAATSGGASAATQKIPSSCSGLPSTLLGADLGGVSTAKDLKVEAGALSCQFANADATKQVILNLGPISAAAYSALQSSSAAGGRTVSTVPDLGTSAFAVSSGGVTGGVTAKSAAGNVYSINSNLTQDQDVALIKQWLALYG